MVYKTLNTKIIIKKRSFSILNMFYYLKKILGNGNDDNKNGSNDDKGNGNDGNDDAGNDGSGNSNKGSESTNNRR